MTAISYSRPPESQVALIRQELVALTQDSQVAVVLNQLLYWCQRVKDFDLFLEEERITTPEDDPPLNYGWMYKTADELIEETLLTVTRPTMRKYLRTLVEEGWMEERSNTDRKWDRTAYFRLNLRKISEELLALGYRLPGFEKGLFDENEQTRNLTSRLENLIDDEERNLTSELRNFTDDEKRNLTSALEKLTGQDSNVDLRLRNLTSKEENLTSSAEKFTEETRNLTDDEERNLTPKLKNLTDEERNFTPKLKNLTAYTYTETTQKNTNIDYHQRLDARENFSDLENSNFENPENSALKNSSTKSVAPDRSVTEKSVAEEMVGLWEHHVTQNFPPDRPEAGNKKFHLTEQRKGQLESLFSFHFQNDMRIWERFCLKVKGTPFLMGGGPNGWVATLDWMLRDGSVLKVLGDKYGDSGRSEQQDHSQWNLEKIQPCPVKDAEKAAIIASIKDPIWKMWCTRLAEGVRLNDFRMAQEPLSAFQLQQITDAYFLECEDERLVWIGSLDQRVLNKIDDLRLQISCVFRNEYPKASTFRTRLAANPRVRGGSGHE